VSEVPTFYERALYIAAQEHGLTRSEAIAWLSDEEEWSETSCDYETGWTIWARDVAGGRDPKP
jgi:hypothetical protein